MNCSNYRGIKLLSHTMKLWERVIAQRLKDIVSISDGQFGFKSGVGTTDAIFVIRTLCEKYREGNKPLDMVFVDLEKAYGTVPREVLWRCMRKQNIPEGYIRLVQDMYQGATTRVKSKRGMSEHFEVEIGLHQGSALSPFLFIMLVDKISQDVRTELPWELLYADDLAIIDITSTDTQNRLESWQKVLMLLSHCGEYPCECKKIYSRQIRQIVANIWRMGLRMQFATNRNDRKMIARYS